MYLSYATLYPFSSPRARRDTFTVLLVYSSCILYFSVGLYHRYAFIVTPAIAQDVCDSFRQLFYGAGFFVGECLLVNDLTPAPFFRFVVFIVAELACSRSVRGDFYGSALSLRQKPMSLTHNFTILFMRLPSLVNLVMVYSLMRSRK